MCGIYGAGKDSPAFDKNKMATFERYFLKEKELHKEIKGHYYTLRNEEKVCDMLLDEFGVVGKHRHIINGHVPVKTIQGENPIKANGKMMVIDGGFSRAYLRDGIAGIPWSISRRLPASPAGTFHIHAESDRRRTGY